MSFPSRHIIDEICHTRAYQFFNRSIAFVWTQEDAHICCCHGNEDHVTKGTGSHHCIISFSFFILAYLLPRYDNLFVCNCAAFIIFFNCA